MAISKKQLHEELRQRYMNEFVEYLKSKGEDVLITASQKFAVPCLDLEGNEEYVEITIKVPTGSRDGDPYDGYGEAEAYAMKVKEQAEKAEKAKAEKERKIARDKAQREAKAKAKAERGQVSPLPQKNF